MAERSRAFFFLKSLKKSIILKLKFFIFFKEIIMSKLVFEMRIIYGKKENRWFIYSNN